MKFAPLLLLLAAPLHAELLATFQTSQGSVIVALQYDKAPQTVANFITLAQGTRARVDARTGALTRTPLYTGEKFYRVVNGTGGNPNFKIAQTGSGTGTIDGGPGYVFRHEFDPALTHVPYVLSMQSNGIHTNGSQLLFTGSSALPSRDDVNTVFGLVTDPSSRSVINSILAAGNNGTTINSITFSRTDPAAVAFNEFEQNLPECQPVPGNLAVALGSAANYLLNEPVKPGTALLAYRSPDLTTWSKQLEVYQGTGQTGFSAVSLDNASLPKAFYQLSMVTYPDALSPASLANRDLMIGLFGNQTLLLQFDGSGAAGIATYSQNPGTPTPFQLTSYTKSAYEATFIVQSNDLGSIRIRGMLDAEKELHILGTHKLDQASGSNWVQATSGGLSLTKPQP